MRTECPVCYTQQRTAESEKPENICETCGDIMEFGYPSFPAYKLEEAIHTEVYGKNMRMAVG
ncbi:hypothetical protein [Aneurinibacillus aneurinilyticus]|uniref:Uncharacterized protein n=1 Tax=Aneurinibacillus aneurinilyticus ATCC 12856 TaxID=649747 RepID=U1X5V1_ANEAE|nr:hypothetical protein [Aneurinibacillus aneurinilyticus]ERI10335.1 hypothetical protein HMPREF0083_01556 [Aneurinibacillus aneurinilyticus ATCC 12856]MED0707656.1 hypothetical protein [Aneurinibacillus aneurinilyticus]MED0725967.1 hypothetical protein [Aneurinibacillus aneurinilyticus]MED0735019.1 hypothetical protein [Aneurinibacillus aneurinilyticus]MED0739758.1 hypothetical protein [Aneurinibacillus aneurinilyticus]